jgi:transcriptional regulator with XRE-family HTH domain
MKYLRLTQREVAEKMNIAQQVFSRAIYRKNGTLLNNLKLAHALNVSAGWLLDEEIDLSEELSNDAPGSKQFRPPTHSIKNALYTIFSASGLGLDGMERSTGIPAWKLSEIDLTVSVSILKKIALAAEVTTSDLIEFIVMTPKQRKAQWLSVE